MIARCFLCGRSVQAGIGPICQASQPDEQTEQDAQRQRNLACHHGRVCANPQHAATTLGRFRHRFDALAGSADLPAEVARQVEALCARFHDALGLKRARVPVPPIPVPALGAATIAALGLPLKLTPHGPAYDLPVDHDAQYRHIQLREMGLCPFGLDCREPGQAVAAVWQLLSLMRSQVEPRLLTEAGGDWAWDGLAYQALANTLEVLGGSEEGQEDYVQRI